MYGDKHNKKFHIEKENSLFSEDKSVKAYYNGSDGKAKTSLSEPIPAYDARAGDVIINAEKLKQGKDNNAMIILGRDRWPYGPDRTKQRPYGSTENPNSVSNQKVNSDASGFSTNSGAGMIDIVVGRGAPFYLPIKSSSTGAVDELPPLYTTSDNPVDKLYGKRLNGYDPNRDNQDAIHKGYMMDAARIYISQMCHVDEYFKVNTVKTPLSDNNPCSAIMLKADKLRMHSRRDVYIVAGGDGSATHDSNGYEINESGRIYLVSKNMRDNDINERGLSSLTRQKELQLCLGEMLTAIQGLAEIVNTLVVSQAWVNEGFANSIYGTATGMTTGNPINLFLNKIKQMVDMKEGIQIHAMKLYNIPKIRSNYLTNTSKLYIGSRNVWAN